MYKLLQQLVNNNELHAKWLNTLSFMENAGARKISLCEHPTKVNIIQLKHAAEEHRHAYYLKKQIGKINSQICSNYDNDELLAAKATRYYLQLLDIQTCRYLKENFQLSGEELKYAAYLFVTYAIEVRADELYPQYQQVLTEKESKVMVKSIILEEEGHLEEMIQQLKTFHPDWEKYATSILTLEHKLFDNWIAYIEKEITNA
ncbi:hypothetical protein [Flavobacterium weaverense]|uniref:Rubrerythrin n=1 Tax=Flavobacterium weaverense TaxID=271156 RepID=A0A3M0A1T2_9FLAO|nr:hypothetical protein [Flavobacterium weaverense]RMA72962.1 hypothetical protein BC961_2558 [Flavobacterium weaverense]